MPRVMISYRNLDGQREFAFALEKALVQAGIDTWLDVKNIPRLSRWEDEIFKGIISSDYVVLCLSPEYFESETCLFECYVARGYGKTLLPLIIDYDALESIFTLINQHEETRGIDNTNYLNFRSQSILGLKEDSVILTQRIINAITQPTPIDIDYDVCFSFRVSQVKFATQVADDLNKAGIKTFIHTRNIDVGADWRRVGWNAMLRSKIHVVILSPDVAQSEYIKNEVLITRTRKPARFLPILAEDFREDAGAKSTIRQTFADSKNLSVLNEIQWFTPDANYHTFINNLIDDIRTMLSEITE
jgi:hypothetical protein